MADEAGAGVGTDRLVDRAHVQPCLAGTRKRVADGGDLRLGEDHARGQVAVGAQDRVLAVPAEDVLGRQARLVLAHVREQHASVGVADDIQPLVAGDPQRRVDRDRLAGLQAKRLHPERVRPGTATDRDEQLISCEASDRPPTPA